MTGGTTGLTDGTLVEAGNTIEIVGLNSPVTVHMRCDSGYWSDDQDFDLPAEVEVSFDGGSTWLGNADEPITAPEVEDVNFPVLVRQTVIAEVTASSFDTDPDSDATYNAISALSTPTLTATVISDTQIDLSWTNVANEDGYLLEWSPNGSSGWAEVEETAANDTSSSHTGLDAGTQYFYRVKALGSGRYSDSGYGTDDATTSAGPFASDDFATGSGDLVGTAPDVGGTWTDGSSSGSPSPVYDSNKIRQQDAATAFTYVATDPGDPDYTVEADVIPQSAGSSGVAGVCGRKNAATGSVTTYAADYYDHATAGSRQWRLYKVVAGVTTVLGTYTENIGTTTKRLKLSMNGTAIKVFVDDVERISVTDSDVTAAGRAGVVVGNASSNTNGPWLDNFVATLI